MMIRPYRTRRIISFVVVIIISIWCLLSDLVRHEDVRFWSVDSMHILPSSTITATTTTAVTMTTTNDPPHRAMQEVDDTYFAYNDLSKYSIKYEKCQFVKMYDDELAALQQQQQGQSSSVSPLATRHFVVYRLCPSDTCGSTTGSASSSSNVCGSTDPTVVYGTYTMTVSEYLYYTVAYQKQVLEQSCNFCNAYCLSSASSSSSTSPYCTTDCTNSLCRTCSTTCDAYQSFTTAMTNGATHLADAADYITCQKLNNDDDDDAANNNNNENADDDAVQYYIGPYCHQSVATSTETAPTYISIGLFSDEYCYSPVTNVNMTQLLGGVTLSYHLFQHTNTAATSSSSKNKNTNNPMQCLSCFESNQNYNNQNDVNDVDDVNEMCENLYTTSAKCESTTGLSNGFIQMNGGNNNNNNDDENNHQYPNNNNQVENEFMVCTFIQSLLYNSYTETGVINLKVSQDYIVRVTTERQRTALILILLTILGLVGTIHYYHRRLQGLLLLPQSSTTTTTTTGPSLRNNPNVLLMPQGEMS